MSKPRVEWSVKQLHGRLLLDDPDNYRGTLNMFIMGRTANIFGLFGIGWFRALPILIVELFAEAKVKYVTFEMLEDTLQRLRAAIGDQCDFAEIDRFIMDGKRECIVVRINLK